MTDVEVLSLDKCVKIRPQEPGEQSNTQICAGESSSACPCPEGKDFEKMENQGVLLRHVHWEDEEDGVAPGASPSSHMSELEDVREMLEKARELFQLCDNEKGFITKVDMQRLQSELPLTLEQLETVFDSLEQNNNGYLTPVEFSMGLGKLMGIELCQGAGRMDHSRHEETFESGWSDDLDPAGDDEEKRFCSMMEQLGATHMFEDPREIRELWARLRKEHPELLPNLEEFLLRVSSYIREVNHEKETMEQALKRKETDHDQEVRCLYEEMEQQIKAERERLLCQEALRHDKSNVLQKLHSKEQELEKILYRQKKLEHHLQSLNSQQLETRVQNKRLRHLNEKLLEELEKCKWELEAVKGQLQKLQKEAQLEQEQKDRDVFRVSKNMQKEKQSLLRQLELLREMNKKLRDERDAFEAKKMVSLRKKILIPSHPPFICCCCCHQSGACHFHGGQ
ncbi:LOW QUALITY PROTEIN: EF-hand calcium-binding domain-containing protein 4A [Pterocles gutturalis]